MVSAVGRVLSRRRFVTLAYHGVDDPQRFHDQISSMSRHRRALTLAEVEDCVSGGRELPAEGFLVTFDDGRRSVYEHGAPVLADLGVPAVLFVIAGLIDGDVPFWWDEVARRSAAGATTTVTGGSGEDLVRALKLVPDDQRRRALVELREATPDLVVTYPHLRAEELLELELAGVAIGSHSLTHPCLDRCDDEVLASELLEARQRLEGLLSHPVRSLAYPNGNVDRRVADAAAAAGHSVAFSFDHRLGRRSPDPMLISRVRVDPSNPTRRFESIVTGVHPAVHHLRGRS